MTTGSSGLLNTLSAHSPACASAVYLALSAFYLPVA